MSVKVPSPLLRYTNGGVDKSGDSWCVGTIRSRKPSLLMSPQIGLPYERLISVDKPAAAETSRNCWAKATDARAVTNPAAVPRYVSAFLMGKGRICCIIHWLPALRQKKNLRVALHAKPPSNR